MTQIPEEVQSVLREVQKFDPAAIIVGGFLRDFMHGKSPKDIDIVVNCMTNPDLIVQALEGTNVDEERIESSAQDVNFTFEMSFDVRGLEWPINIIGARKGQSPLEKLKSHDFGLCQIWYDGKEIQYTSAYGKDVIRETMTLQRCNSLEEWEAVKTHYFRVAKKYPYPMVISHDFMQKIFQHKFPDLEEDSIPF